jgi:hypothetical protein
MKVADRIATLFANNGINAPENDVRWASGWDRKIHTAQYRFGARESGRLANAIRELPKATQRALIRELDRRSTKDTYVGSTSFISSAAASAMNKLAKELGLENTFDVDSRRRSAPMG